MSKIINITNILLKEFSISKNEGKINIRLSYSLLDDNGKEYDQKADSILDGELTAGQKTYINNITLAVENKLKLKEGIN
jgi:hypothetical protein